MAMARRFSVTVSIAALRIGTFSRMRRVSRELTSTWLGSTRRVARDEQDVVEREGFGQTRGDLCRRAQSLSHSRDSSLHVPHAPWHFLYFLPLPH